MKRFRTWTAKRHTTTNGSTLGTMCLIVILALPEGLVTTTLAWIYVIVMLVVIVFTLRKTRRLRKESPLDKASKHKNNLTVRQATLVSKITTAEGAEAFGLMVELWEAIYGQPVDMTRSMQEIVDEVSVGLNGLTS